MGNKEIGKEKALKIRALNLVYVERIGLEPITSTLPVSRSSQMS